MNEFLKLLQQESAGVIEGLTGHSAILVLEEETIIDTETSLTIPCAAATIESDGAKLLVSMEVGLATALGDLMLGGEGESQESMNDDDLDATKEIISNIFGALSTTLSAQPDLPKLSFAVQDIHFFEESAPDLSPYATLYDFNFSVASASGTMQVAVDTAFAAHFGEEAASAQNRESAGCETEEKLSEEELKNISLIMDVELPVRVRIGTKTVLLKDVLNMDIGSVVELDQLANEPLDVLIGDKIIAKGEVVIVDGNFGIQITEIGTPKERLSQIK
jgi:flagellar motor switch protein FliN/FliY